MMVVHVHVYVYMYNMCQKIAVRSKITLLKNITTFFEKNSPVKTLNSTMHTFLPQLLKRMC